MQPAESRRTIPRWNLGHKNVRASYALSYLVIMLVVLLMVTPILLWGIRSIRDEALASKRVEVTSVISALENEIASYHNQVEAMKPSILQVASFDQPFSPREIYQLGDQNQQINRRIVERTYVHDALILYENNMLVTSVYAFADSNYFNDYYRRDQTGDIERPIVRLRNNAQNQIVGTTWYGQTWSRNHGVGNYLEYTIPVKSYSVVIPAHFVLVIDLDALYDNLASSGVIGLSLKSVHSGTLFLGDETDERNLDLFADDLPSDLVLAKRSQLLDVDFLLRMDEHSLNLNMRDMGLLLFTYLNIILAIGILLAIVLSKKQSRPLEEIYAEITQSSESQTTLGYKDIRRSIVGLQSSIVEYEARLKTLRDSRNASAFERLLWGIEEDWPDDIDEEFLQMIQSDRFRLTLISYSSTYSGTPDSAKSHVLVEALTNVILKNRYSKKLYLHPVEQDRFIVLIPASIHDNSAEERAYWTHVLDDVLRSYDVSLTVVVSKLCQVPSEIRDAYSAVRNYMGYHTQATALVLLDDLQGDALRIASSTQLGQIQDSLLEGRAEVSELIRKLWVNAAPSTQDEQAQLYYSIKNTLDNVCRQLPAEAQPDMQLELFEGHIPVQNFIEELADYGMEIAAGFMELKETYKNPIISTIIQYMEEHFADPDLYGKSISDQFNISEKYFFTLFKSTVGVSFSEYLTTLRLKEATKLLLTDDANITVIAERVGYRSADTFSKAYKRAYGMTPGQVRRSNVMQSIVPQVRGD